MNFLPTTQTSHKGQIFVVTIFLMILALSIGVVVSRRYIFNIRNITFTDSGSRAQLVAESGIEKFLAIPNETLESYINLNSCGTECSWSYTDQNGITSSVNVELSFSGNTSSVYTTNVKQSNAGEVSLEGMDANSAVNVCWDTPASVYASYIHRQGNTISSDIFGYNPSNYTGEPNGFTLAATAFSHSNCFSFNTEGTSLVLRLKPFYYDTDFYIIPDGGITIPVQGIQIKAVGTSSDATRVIIVVKKAPVMSGVFDYVLYQKSPTDALSNN